MNRKELSSRISEQSGYPVSFVSNVIGHLIDEVQCQLAKGDAVKLQGLGTFEAQQRAPRRARHILKDEWFQAPGKVVPSFKPSRILKEKVMTSEKPG